ncbi:MAG TPA: radical SAM family heme chaperone HemW [Flavihumibacter sp.]|nr:radical SAM family heme chaperone HemW [Flavihumibacter sp.]
MAGLYLHIPFCRKACHYCNFHFSTRLQYKNEVTAAILKELARESFRLEGQKLETIYFGGGTPSLLSSEEISTIFSAIRRHFLIDADAEITLEANPDDIEPGLLAHWKWLGINRLSIGVQSFREEDLRWMNRAHSAAEAEAAVQKAKAAGFTDFNLDLIYGIPGLSDAAWQENISKALAQGINHLSAYALTVEPKTALAVLIDKLRMPDIDPTQQADQFLLLVDQLDAAGWEQYEISNFAVPGHRSRHNSAYWEGAVYLGIGPGAHSYDGRTRRWNVSNNALYVNGIEKGISVSEEEILSDDNRFNEYIMTSLRRREGISLARVAELGGVTATEKLLRSADIYFQSGALLQEGEQVVLSRSGKLFADGIASALFC